MLTTEQQGQIGIVISLATASEFRETIRINRIVRDRFGMIYVEIADVRDGARRGYMEIRPDGEILAGPRVGTHRSDLVTVIEIGSHEQHAQQLAAVGYRVDAGRSGNRRVTRGQDGVVDYVGYVMYLDGWHAFRAGAEKVNDSVGTAETPESAALLLANWDDRFDPAQVSIKRHRKSATQGEVAVCYDGALLGRYGDDIRIITDLDVLANHSARVASHWKREELADGDGRQVVGGFAGLPDSAWVAAAEREIEARRQRESRRIAAVLWCTTLHVRTE